MIKIIIIFGALSKRNIEIIREKKLVKDTIKTWKTFKEKEEEKREIPKIKNEILREKK